MNLHELKCWPAPFADVVRDIKHHEIRCDDREPRYQVGDRLLLREWRPNDLAPGFGDYTGRRQLVAVTYITRGPDWGIPVGLVVMSIERRSLRELP